MNQSKFVFESCSEKTKLVMERGRLREKDGTERERGPTKKKKKKQEENDERGEK